MMHGTHSGLFYPKQTPLFTSGRLYPGSSVVFPISESTYFLLPCLTQSLLLFLILQNFNNYQLVVASLSHDISNELAHRLDRFKVATVISVRYMQLSLMFLVINLSLYCLDIFSEEGEKENRCVCICLA